MRWRRRAILPIALVLVAGTVAAGPLDWITRKLFDHASSKPAMRVVSADTSGPIILHPDQPVRIEFGENTPQARFPQGNSHFHRFLLSQPLVHAEVHVRVLAQQHDTHPRFTVYRPLLYLLDEDGSVRDSTVVSPLNLDIRPFKRTELRGCMRVDGLRYFIVATPASSVGKMYAFDARPDIKPHPDHGFYQPTSPIKVYLPYAATGELVLRVTPAGGKNGKGRSC